MIGNISSKLVKKLVDKNVIDSTEQELYVYGFFMLLSHIIYLLITVIFGILLNTVLESVIFYVAFQFIRRYAGGIHASSELKCELSTTLSIFLCLLCVKICKIYNADLIVLLPTAVSAVLTFVLCPLDTPEKPLSREEMKYFRKITWIILTVIILILCIARYFELYFLMYPCCMSIILESILLVLGKIKKSLNKNSL